MKKLHLSASLIALQLCAFNNDIAETVVITTKGGDVRINKADYDADQAEGGAKQYTLASKAKQADNAATDAATTANNVPPGTIVPPAPSAPNFNPAPGEQAPPSATGAVPPVAPSVNSYLVMKEGKKYFIVDTAGVKQGAERGFDPAGYATEELAVTAIKFAPPVTSPTAADPAPAATPPA
jgi:hypothetical protein